MPEIVDIKFVGYANCVLDSRDHAGILGKNNSIPYGKVKTWNSLHKLKFSNELHNFFFDV